MPAPLPDAVREAIAADVRAGGTCRGVARTHGVSPSTVRKVAAESGITDAFSRAATAKATEAKVADLAARRAALADGLLYDAEHFRRRARAPYVQLIATRDEVHERTLDEPPLGDVKHAMSALGVAVTQHIALLKHDTSTDQGNTEVDRWLAHMIGNLIPAPAGDD